MRCKNGSQQLIFVESFGLHIHGIGSDHHFGDAHGIVRAQQMDILVVQNTGNRMMVKLLTLIHAALQFKYILQQARNGRSIERETHGNIYLFDRGRQ